MEPIKKIFISYLDIRRNEYSKLYKRFLSDKRRVLDAGCGVGNFIQFNPKHIEGIDQNSQSLRIARKRGFTVTRGQLDRLPFKDSSFDGIFCAHVIEHLIPRHAVSMLYEFVRVLKKNGTLVITAPLMYSRFYNDLTHIRPYPPESILDYLINTPQTTTQRTAFKRNTRFILMHLSYRYDYLYYPQVEPSRLSYRYQRILLNMCKATSLILYRFGIKNYFSKNGYTLVLRKSF